MNKNERDMMLVNVIVNDNSSNRELNKATTVLFNKFYPIMMSFVRKRFSNLSEMQRQDVVVSGLTKGFRKSCLEIYEPTHLFSSWLSSIVKNKAIDFVRKENKMRTTYIDDLGIDEYDNPVEISVDYSSPENIMISEENCEMIKRCVSKLSVGTREVMRLRLISQMKDREIISHLWGDELSESEIISKANTVRATLFRGREALKEIVRKEIACEMGYENI